MRRVMLLKRGSSLKAHSADFAVIDEATQAHLAQILQDVLKSVKKVLGNPSYNYYLHTAPIGYANGACYHWHIEIIPKLTRSVGFEWGTGLHIVPTFPQDAARFLQGSLKLRIDNSRLFSRIGSYFFP